jgi:hypothetical protein
MAIKTMREVVATIAELNREGAFDDLLRNVREMRRRAAWRQYARTALASGACTSLCIDPSGVPYRNRMKYADLKQVAQYADEMLKLERERFEKESP